MADIAQLEAALVKADAAGDVEGARVLAGEIRRMRGATQPAQPQQNPDAPYEPTGVEKLAASVPVRFATAAASPFMALAEIMEDKAGLSPEIAKTFKEFRAMQERGAGHGDVSGGLLPEGWNKGIFPSNVSETASDVAGTILSPLFLAGAKALPVFSGATTKAGKVAQALKNVGVSASAGFVGGGLTPGEGKLDRAETGALIGAAMPAVIGTANGVYNIGKNLSSGSKGAAQRYLDEVFGGKDARMKVAAELERLRVNELGEKPTAGLAAVSGDQPIPQLKALEELARSSPKSGETFARIDAANSAARVAPLERMAAPGRRYYNASTGKMDASELEQIRRSVTQPLYKKANSDMVQINPRLESALDSAQTSLPMIRAYKSIEQAQANMAAGGRAIPKSFEPGYVPQQFNAYTSEIEPTPFMPRYNAYSIDALQRIKNELTERIAASARNPDPSATMMTSQLKDARRLLTNEMKAQSGNYALANQLYKNAMPAENQAKLSQALLDALKTPAGKDRPGVFLNAMRDQPKTIGRAGIDEFENVRQIYTPEQMRNVITPLEKSLTMEQKYIDLPASQGILPKQSNVFLETEKDFPGWLHRVVTAVRKGLQTAGGKITQDSVGMINDMVADPKAMAEFLRQATPAERNAVEAYLKGINKNMIPAVGAQIIGNQGE